MQRRNERPLLVLCSCRLGSLDIDGADVARSRSGRTRPDPEHSPHVAVARDDDEQAPVGRERKS